MEWQNQAEVQIKWENVHAHITWSNLREAMKMFSKKIERCISFPLQSGRLFARDSRL